MSFRTFEELAQDAVRLNNAPLPAFKVPDVGPTPSAGETITAAFRQDNTVASFLSSKTLGHDNYDDGAFMPSEYAKEVGMADQVDAFKGVMNRPLAEAIKQQLEMDAARLPGLVRSLGWTPAARRARGRRRHRCLARCAASARPSTCSCRS